MQTYKAFLKYLLTANILFIFVVAGLGYRQEYEEKNLAEVTAALTSKDKVVKDKVIPVGQTVGIYVNTDGILVIDTGEVTDLTGKNCSPAKNKLMPGDYITRLNGTAMNTKKQLITAITNCQGETLIFGVLRNGEEIEVKVEPVQTAAQEYKVGIWVRDDLQGLGTVTYVDGERFGALGHSINDSDTGSMLKVSCGEIYAADIFGVERGTAGNPGEIEGMIAYQTENVVGHIDGNQVYGIYGTVTEAFQEFLQADDALEIASVDEVKNGKAYIQSYVSGEMGQYEIEISNVHKNENGDPEMEILVTDEKLIELTGGIVQGMSGSPIIQNGKLVGAVTHVFVDEPTKGYGIFVESMRDSEKKTDK
ncbi:MAG: PDZ domain-containing protein [Clostridium sp.]|nr:PDZ domain-containing protein [Clostridium sp.]